MQWALGLDVDDIRQNMQITSDKPLYIVGSGGSLSACYFAAQLYQNLGMMAKAITPLELYYSRNALKRSNVLFISASGKNTDILFAYKTAIHSEPNRIYSICMVKNSPLSILASESSICCHYEFENPAGKDGFLATNSLVAFFSILANSINVAKPQKENIVVEDRFNTELDSFFNKIYPDTTFTVLHAGWGQPVAIDIESKLAEAALGNVLISDYRNFGHGRHHWFDKRINNSAIIALVTPEEKLIAEKTLSLLPASIPILMIESCVKSSLASLDLLQKSFLFVERLGSMQNIDPGRPGVPDFGSKLYHLKYQRFYDTKEKLESTRQKIAIVRKADIPYYDFLGKSEKEFWQAALSKFIKKLNSAKFGTIVFDYDGTICSAKNRTTGIDDIISESINRILDHGLIIGIATGRGKSVRTDLKKKIAERHWNQVVIGYYNCSDFGSLDEDEIPNVTLQVNPILAEIYEKLKQQHFTAIIHPELKPHQIVIESDNKENWKKVRVSIIQYLIGLNIPSIQILESNHSMDIIDQTTTNKLNILDYCRNIAIKNQLPKDCLCIGDKGKWPGNDYQLLSSEYSLSVDEVTSLPESCWNFAPPGVKNIEGTLYYLSCLVFEKNTLTFKLQ